MSISAIMNNAVSGMQANSRRLATTANNVANVMTPGYDRQVTTLSTVASGGAAASTRSSGGAAFPDASNVDLGQEMLDMIDAGIGFEANASVFEAGADMWDVLMSIKRDSGGRQVAALRGHSFALEVCSALRVFTDGAAD